MDINLLVLSLGNSRLAMGAFDAGGLRLVQRIEIDRLADWPEVIKQVWGTISDKPDATIAAASVNPPLDSALEEAVLQATGRNVPWVGKQIDLPISVVTDPPEQTGVDRVVNVAAAYEQMQKACIVVDAGTAVTISCCNEDGDLIGGVIAPGAEMMLKALHEQTATLPKVDFDIPAGFVGRSTQSAIQSGVYHGIRGLVKEVAEGYAVELGQWPEIIATGGDAKKLFDDWELIHAIAPDLTLYGVALAYVEHHIKHGA